MLPFAAPLAHRSIIRIGGVDRAAFLQRLVSNDVAKATDSAAIYAALLTPQGKFLHDMLIVTHGDAFLVECEAARAEDLLRRLAAYKLRAKVTFDNMRDVFDVWAVWGSDYHAPLCFTDPRLPEMGFRLFGAKDSTPSNVTIADAFAYDTHRLTYGIADGSRDMEIEKSTLAEGNFDLLNGIDWKKGCYVGQELTARMHYRGLAKKRLFPVRLSAPVAAGTAISFNGAECGMLRSNNGGIGLALLALDAVNQSNKENRPFICQNSEIVAAKPLWMPQKE